MGAQEGGTTAREGQEYGGVNVGEERGEETEETN